MRSYIIRRLLLMIPTVLLVTIIVFMAVRLIPGDVIDAMASDTQDFSEMDRDALRHALGLDVPIHTQFFRWVRDLVLHGSIGNSLWRNVPVMDEICKRLPVTIELGLLSMIIGLLIALPIGTYAAIRQDTAGDYIGRSIAVLAIALPDFWVATMIICFGSIWFGWSPPIMIIPFTEDPLGNLGQFIVPAIVLGLISSGTNLRMTRATMLEVLRQDYIRTAWAKGLSEKMIVIRHALRNSLLPVITVLGLQVPVTIGGSVVIEKIFGLPGVGRLVLDSAMVRDYPVISGVLLVLAISIMLINLLVDLAYGYIDPRIRYK